MKGLTKTIFLTFFITLLISVSLTSAAMKIWIKDPNGNYVVSGTDMSGCTPSGSTETCYNYYYTCRVTGWYQGRVQDVDSGTYSPWTNLWYCTCECSSGVCCDGCDYKPSSTVCNQQYQTDYGCPWGTVCGDNVGVRYKHQYCSGTSSSCSGSVSNWGSWSVYDSCGDVETCADDDSSCNYEFDCSCGNNVCDYSENCLNCIQDCGCTINTLCCPDGICKSSCESVNCDYDDLCEVGESCNCADCYDEKDACRDDLICDETTNTCQCPPDKPYWNEDLQICGPSPLCGNGVCDDGENCCNCPYDCGCGYEKICHCLNYDTCTDCSCQDEDGGPCNYNDICDSNEVCNCPDCHGWEDRCLRGLVCSSETERCDCKLLPDGICPDDPDCELVDPDCLKCDNDNICEDEETQDNCGDDCRTIVTISPPQMYAGAEVNVTVYFNDSRYASGENAKIKLYIGDVEWSNCPIHNSRWEDMGCDMSSHWEGMYQESHIEITSLDNYAEISFNCTVPTDLPQGTHILRVVPSIFSEEIELNAGESEFFVVNNFFLFLKFILDSIKMIF